MVDELDLGRVPALHQLGVELVPEHVLFKVSTDLEDTFEQGRGLVRVGRGLSGPDVQSEAATNGRNEGRGGQRVRLCGRREFTSTDKAGRTLTMTPVTRSSEGSPISLLPASVSYVSPIAANI